MIDFLNTTNNKMSNIHNKVGVQLIDRNVYNSPLRKMWAQQKNTLNSESG